MVLVTGKTSLFLPRRFFVFSLRCTGADPDVTKGGSDIRPPNVVAPRGVRGLAFCQTSDNFPSL